MANYKIIFNPQELLNLLTHYTDGRVPRDAEALAIERHPQLANIFRLTARAREWPGAPCALINNKLCPDILQPLEFRYQGRRTLCWDDKGSQPQWEQSRERPKDNKV